jgi:hypothetical protein
MLFYLLCTAVALIFSIPVVYGKQFNNFTNPDTMASQTKIPKSIIDKCEDFDISNFR